MVSSALAIDYACDESKTRERERERERDIYGLY